MYCVNELGIKRKISGVQSNFYNFSFLLTTIVNNPQTIQENKIIALYEQFYNLAVVMRIC